MQTIRSIEPLLTLQAGGPGSGRHPGEGIAKRFGYRYKDSSNTDDRYVKGGIKPGTGHELTLLKGGARWTHAMGSYKQDDWSGTVKRGKDIDSLENHLRSIHGNK